MLVMYGEVASTVVSPLLPGWSGSPRGSPPRYQLVLLHSCPPSPLTGLPRQVRASHCSFMSQIVTRKIGDSLNSICPLIEILSGSHKVFRHCTENLIRLPLNICFFLMSQQISNDTVERGNRQLSFPL